MLCLVRKPTTTLDCVLIKEKSLVSAAGLGPEISSRACHRALLRPRHIVKCWLSIQLFMFFSLFCLETPSRTPQIHQTFKQPFLVSLSAISFPHTQPCPGTQFSPTVCWVEVLFSVFWHCRTNGEDVLAA